jgi:hypothetical protein
MKPPKWMVAAVVLGAVYLAALGIGLAIAFVRLQDQVHTNRRNAQIFVARDCVSDHEEIKDIRAAVNITPTAIVEVTGNGDTDPVQMQAFLDSIKRQVLETLEFPTCDFDEALEQLERLGVEP